MAKIKAADLIADFQRMRDEHWAYEANAEEEGKVDCSGAFVWAYRQHGKSIYHGSNRIARVYVRELLPIEDAEPGMAAFKAWFPGETGYDLPSAYQPGGAYYNGDPADYYHVGLVSGDGRHVLNARSTADGFVESDIRDGWSYVGYLTDVNYGEDPAESEPAPESTEYRVIGGRLNLRVRPSKKSPAIRSLAEGEIVKKLGGDGEWMRVRAGRETGYAMASFLTPVGGGAPGAYVRVPAEQWNALTLAFEAVKAAADQ